MSIHRWLNWPKRDASILVARRERVGQRCLPGAGPRRREYEYLAGGGLEDLLQVAQHAQRELGKLRGAVVLHRHHHRPLHAVGDVGGSGDEEKIPAGHTRGHHGLLLHSVHGWRGRASCAGSRATPAASSPSVPPSCQFRKPCKRRKIAMAGFRISYRRAPVLPVRTRAAWPSSRQVIEMIVL